MPEELRRDPEDGKVYTFAELSSFYSSQKYSKKDILAYWKGTCTVVTPKAKTTAKVDAKEKPEAKETANVTTRSDFKYMEVGGLCVCGEALIDFLPCTTTDAHSAFRPAFGGSPFNCCVAAQRLGIPVTFLGGLSKDMFGEQLHRHLERAGVDVTLAPRFAKNPTTLAFVSRDEGGEKYAFFKENAADRSITKAHVMRALSRKRFRAVHMSLGAVTLEDETCAAAFQTLYSETGKQGALRCFDPNIRANMISERPAKYSKRIEKLLRSVDLVKTSEEDAEFLYGKDANLSDLAAKWLKLGPKMVVFTLGSKGAAAFVKGADSELMRKDAKLPDECMGGKTLNDSGKFVDVSDTVGAGDTFMGGLISGCLGSAESTLLPQLVEKQPWTARDTELVEDVLRLAVTAAAINCSRIGCDPPALSDVEKHIIGGAFKHLKLDA